MNTLQNNPVGLQLITILNNMANELIQIESPTIGLQRRSPFQSCLDLPDSLAAGSALQCSSQESLTLVRQGKYWIDPNHGSSSDAIEVHCLVENGKRKTCLPSIDHSNDEPYLQLTYAPISQLRFLRILHNRIEQNITMPCHSTAANQAPSVNMTLLSLDDLQYDINQISNLSVNDECQVRCTSKVTSPVLCDFPRRIISRDRSCIE